MAETVKCLSSRDASEFCRQIALNGFAETGFYFIFIYLLFLCMTIILEGTFIAVLDMIFDILYTSQSRRGIKVSNTSLAQRNGIQTNLLQT